ncbi:Ig-like domain-containing protein [Prevotella copri]|uniref:Ig-like domain-containing protein n=1 Tax=Segatella copri TaxID=165179 RepID=A0AAW5IRV4_9BACT|nr:Ig-like domain-containing protein [Segatella copri]MCP9551397.1 Ig-like domain-containing protein [Segatella copri]MCP9572136.1 Ig-like domain-containing protein [Segatella copri]MCP9575178.1 Ig-like domain-containing protein [Segatella copri]MCP9578124.1 Ig-like domain-containing protein [Segatella copri]MCP9581186.1 Ig-like domain-containing protein [Segatella copri]
MKKNLLRLGLSLIALFVMVVANAQTYQNEEASVSWPFNDDNYATQYTKSPENGFSLVSVNTGDLKYSLKTSLTTKDKDGNKMVMAGFGPVGTTKAVEWTVKPSKGLTFTPTSISTYVNRFGTDAENGVTVTAKLSDGTSVDLGNFTALRENKTTETDKFSKNENLTNHIVIQLTAEQQAQLTSAEGFTLSCTVGVGSTKQQGFADVHINGLLNGTVQQVKQYTLSAAVSTVGAGTVKVSPAGTVFDAETSITVTATKNFGYKFVNWTDANNQVVSTDETYTFSISANTALKANFEKINTYALNYKVEGGAKDYMISASPVPTVVEGKNMYEEGTEVTLTASSNDILTFTNWNDGETGAERKIKMNADQSFTAAYSAKDFIAGWDFYKSAREGRTADFAAEDNDVDQLILRDADGNTYTWLDKSNSAGGYEGKNAAVNWTSKKTKPLGETYWQTKVNATAFTDIKVKSSMLYNYNAYETYNVEYSLNGTDWTKVGAIKMPGAKAWTDGEFTLPSDANNKAEVYIRWIADKTSSIKGATGDNDGISITNIYITGTAQLVNDGKAPVLVSTIPAEGATNASANGKIVLTFDEKVKLTGNAAATLGTQKIEGAVSGKTITFAYKGLNYATAYTFTLAAGSVADLTDNATDQEIVLNFTTKTKPAVTKALYDFIVPTDGDFKTALDAAAKRTDTSKRFRIFIKQGDYKIPADEKSKVTGSDGKSYANPTTYMNTPNVSIIGEGMDNTSLTNTVPNSGQSANVLEGIGKGDVLCLQKGATNTYFQDLKMYSSMGDAKGRDIVLNDQSNRTVCKNVILWAYQDTYVSNNQNGKFYFEDGILRGRTDYLCGKGDVYYNNVELWICEKGGYLAVPSQPKKYGYIFKDCTIKDATEAKDLNGNYALGRPWGKGTPIALYIDTKMEAIPSAAGWNEMSGGYPKRFAEYNSYTSTGSVVDLKDRKKVYDAYDSKDGDNYVNRRNETAGDPILAAEEAAFYTVENIMGQDDDWDPTAATEQASAPTNVKLNGTTLAWDNNDYALLWAVCKNGKVVDFTITPSYIVDDASATWSVRAANEMGGLSEATVVGQGTGIRNITSATDAAVIKTTIYAADGTQLSNLQKGINIIVKTLADGSKKTSKVIVK